MLAIEDMADDETLTAIEQALERFGSTGTRVYAVIQAAQESTELERVGPPFSCTRHVSAMTNCGVAALPFALAAALRRFAISPRMGLLRRPFSEAMDKLVGAVRMGCSVSDAQRQRRQCR